AGEQVSRRNAAPKWLFPGKPRGSPTLKAAGGVTVTGRGDVSRGEVDDCGALEQDDPVTWETPWLSTGRTGIAEAPYQTPPTRPASTPGAATGGTRKWRCSTSGSAVACKGTTTTSVSMGT